MENALSPLDGRYAKILDPLRPFFSEEALNKARLLVEARSLIALSDEPGVRELPRFKAKQRTALEKIVTNFSARDAAAIKQLEKKTNHDVKAVEYFLRSKVERISGLKRAVPFVHFALTSEDVNNLAYGTLVQGALKNVIRPELKSVISDLKRLALRWKNVPLLSLTHGQPATPTTVGKEIMVFVDRLQRQDNKLRAFRMQGKFGGAVGTYAAHRAAYPAVRWESFGTRFIRSLGLHPLKHTTQSNPHDDLAELSDLLAHINTIMLDLSRDMWLYISRGVFVQKLKAGEVGSSTMPHKVNPIDFENAEGNLGVSTALLRHFADKLPISRLQRDLSDSTVQRSIGVAFGHHLLAVSSLRKGLGKINIDRVAILRELDAHPELAAEAIQTVLRKHGVIDAYEQLKKLTRGKAVTKEKLHAFIDGLALPKKEKEQLKRL